MQPRNLYFSSWMRSPSPVVSFLAICACFVLCGCHPLSSTHEGLFGNINSLTAELDGQVSNYIIKVPFQPTDPISKHNVPNSMTIETPASSYDTGRSVVLTRGDEQLILILATKSVEVYRNNLNSLQTEHFKSIPLRQGTLPWYLSTSGSPNTAVFYITYLSGPPSRYEYINGEFRQSRDRNLEGMSIAVKVPRDDLYVYSEICDEVNFYNVGEDAFPEGIRAEDIGSCSCITNLYPLDPPPGLSSFETVVNFVVNCSSLDGSNRQYHVRYNYVLGNEPTVIAIEDGVPVGTEGYLAVRSDNKLVIYDTENLQNGVPGSHTLPGPIKQVQPLRSAKTWFTVSMEDSNIFIVDANMFVSSLGERGFFELSDTNIGVCEPVCLPQLLFGQHHFFVSAYDAATMKYKFVEYFLQSPQPFEVTRLESVPKKPSFFTFIEELNPPTSATATTTDTPASSESPGIVGFDVKTIVSIVGSVSAAVVFCVVAIIVVVSVVLNRRRIKRWFIKDNPVPAIPNPQEQQIGGVGALVPGVQAAPPQNPADPEAISTNTESDGSGALLIAVDEEGQVQAAAPREGSVQGEEEGRLIVAEETNLPLIAEEQGDAHNADKGIEVVMHH